MILRARSLTELKTPRGVVASARQPEQLFDLHTTMNAVMFFLPTMEPLTRASNLLYLPFWQNAFSAFDLLELSTLKSRRFCSGCRNYCLEGGKAFP